MHILIVTNKLGTNEGVGGRRWLGYGRELISRGHDVRFLTGSGVTNELADLRDRITVLQGTYPKALRGQPSAITDKLKYRAALAWRRLRIKGSPYDETILLKNRFIQIASELIEKYQINRLVVSGAPFSLLYFGSLLKKKFPEMQLICDFRDEWTSGIGYGMRRLSARNLAAEKKREQAVVKSADIILTASDDIASSLIRQYKEIKPYTLLNYAAVPIAFAEAEDAKDQQLRFVISHLGSVNIGTEKYWMRFLDAVSFIREVAGRPVTVQYIGNSTGVIKNYCLSRDHSFVRFFPAMPADEYNRLLRSSDALVLFKHDQYPDSFPTKFFEYLRFRKPIIAWTARGKVSAEIEREGIGIVFNETSTTEEVRTALQKMADKRMEFPRGYDSDKFSLPVLTIKLEALISGHK